MFKKYKHIFLLLFYLLITIAVGVYFSKKSSPDSFISQLRLIRLNDIIRTFINIFSISFLISMSIVAFYLRLSHDKEVDRIRKFEFNAFVSLISSASLVFSLAINLSVYQFELLLDIISMILFFGFAINFFINHTK